jgi:hypothetical protein
MKKRVLVLATVAALMGVMLIAMASVALAVPPDGDTGCAGAAHNAGSAIGTGDPSSEHASPNAPGAPYRSGPGSDHGFDTAEDNTFDTSNCHN